MISYYLVYSCAHEFLSSVNSNGKIVISPYYLARNIVVLVKLSSFKIYELSVIEILDVILI